MNCASRYRRPVFTLICVFAVSLVFSSSNVTAQEVRTWKNSEGKSLKATFVKVVDSTVHLRTSNKDGDKIVKVSLDKLSSADQSYVKKLTSGSAIRLDKELRQRLAEYDFKITSGELTHTSTGEMSRKIASTRKDVKRLREAEASIKRLEEDRAAGRQTMRDIMATNVEVNARLSELSRTHRDYNKLVSANNANVDRLRIMRSDLENLDGEMARQKSELGKQREIYIQKIVDLQSLSRAIREKATELASDADFQQLLGDIEKATGHSVTLGESRSLARARKKLELIAETVHSESIPLEGDGSNSFQVMASINGKPLKMVFDTGADLILLSSNNAIELGVKIPADAQKIPMVVADGSRVTGHLIKLATVRVGSFSAEQVDCVVMGPEAKNAATLLGMSFLSRFKFELNANEKKLTMVRIEAEKQ